MPMMRLAPKVGKAAPIGALPPQHPPRQRLNRKEIEPQDQSQGQPRQLEPQDQPQGQPRQLEPQDQDADRGSDASKRQQNRDEGHEAKESTKQDGDDFLSRFLPFGVGGTGVPAPGMYRLNLRRPIREMATAPALDLGVMVEASAISNQGMVDLTDESFSGPMGQPLNEVEAAKPKRQPKRQPVTTEDADSALTSFAAQELGRQSARVRRRRTGAIIPRPQLALVRPEPPKPPAVPDWVTHRIRPLTCLGHAGVN